MSKDSWVDPLQAHMIASMGDYNGNDINTVLSRDKGTPLVPRGAWDNRAKEPLKRVVLFQIWGQDGEWKSARSYAVRAAYGGVVRHDAPARRLLECHTIATG